MASFWNEISKDRELRRRTLRRMDAWAYKETLADQRRVQREAGATSNARRAEEAGGEREAGMAEAARRNAALAADLETLGGVLAAVVDLPARTLLAMRQDFSTIEFEPSDEGLDEPRPAWVEFAPPEPGRFGRRKYERAVAVAKAAFDRACQDHERRRSDALEAARRAHEVRMAAARREHEERWDDMASAVARRDPDAIAEFVGAILLALPPLSGLLGGGRAVYQPEPREVVVELELPDTDVIPTERTWLYVHVRRAMESRPRPAKDAARLYAEAISRITLAVIHAFFHGVDCEVVDAVTINGHVRTIDPATGRPDHPCLITVTANRATFDELVLDSHRLDPAKCLKFLGAELSRHPYELERVEPFIDFDLAKYRLVTAAEALVQVDHRDDLHQMNPYEFEKLVKQLFIEMGYETWRTTSSRDDGIDAVAVGKEGLFLFECVIQAKRTRNIVPPKDVQALIGAMAEKGTATHGVLVTTSWLSDRSRQRARAKRIYTIEGNVLAGLIEKHLKRKVVISGRPLSH